MQSLSPKPHSRALHSPRQLQSAFLTERGGLRGVAVRRSRYRSLDHVLSEMERLIKDGRSNPHVRDVAVSAVAMRTDFSDEKALCQALLDFIVENVVYVPDPVDVEYLQGADVLLASRAGDCDDFSILFCSMAMALGVPCRLRVVGFSAGADQYEHVYPEAFCGGTWVAADGTLRQRPVLMGDTVADVAIERYVMLAPASESSMSCSCSPEPVALGCPDCGGTCGDSKSEMSIRPDGTLAGPGDLPFTSPLNQNIGFQSGFNNSMFDPFAGFTGANHLDGFGLDNNPFSNYGLDLFSNQNPDGGSGGEPDTLDRILQVFDRLSPFLLALFGRDRGRYGSQGVIYDAPANQPPPPGHTAVTNPATGEVAWVPDGMLPSQGPSLMTFALVGGVGFIAYRMFQKRK